MRSLVVNEIELIFKFQNTQKEIKWGLISFPRRSSLILKAVVHSHLPLRYVLALTVYYIPCYPIEIQKRKRNFPRERERDSWWSTVTLLCFCSMRFLKGSNGLVAIIIILSGQLLLLHNHFCFSWKLESHTTDSTHATGHWLLLSLKPWPDVAYRVPIMCLMECLRENHNMPMQPQNGQRR